ncbi:MAG: MarR family transcriptional regulator [Microlunatus sp.]|nr:MarR family transcriptional regulator [Microlunatus sp.]
MPIERDQAASLLEALVSLVRVTRTIAHRDAAHSVAATPVALLKLVSKTDPRLGDLAERLHIKPSVASRAVAALEAEGYVSRVTDPADARVCRVHMTEAGRSYLQAREEWALEMVARSLSDWSAEDADATVCLLGRLERSVDEWAGHFERAATDGSDPLAEPVTGSEAPGDPPDPGPGSPSNSPENQSADGAVPAENDHNRLTTASTTHWETTAL